MTYLFVGLSDQCIHH